jgi:hypothetical protein
MINLLTPAAAGWSFSGEIEIEIWVRPDWGPGPDD